METTAKIIKFERNEEDLQYPFVIIEYEGKQKKINIPVKILTLVYGVQETEDYINLPLILKKKIGRKYIRYFFDLSSFKLDIKEWEFKQLQEVKE